MRVGKGFSDDPHDHFGAEYTHSERVLEVHIHNRTRAAVQSFIFGGVITVVGFGARESTHGLVALVGLSVLAFGVYSLIAASILRGRRG
ncbi:hypothetical protein [Streptomyces alkaliterrae]|nr:hypothetical protein [Streptomyces alkaliterrae]